MTISKNSRWIIAAVGLFVIVALFLAFRPDKIFLDDAVDESLGEAFGTPVVTTTVPPTTQADDAVAPGGSSTETTTPEETTNTTAPAAPAVVSSGEFVGIDHAAVGTATVYEQDGKQILRFEDDTDIQNGPDLYIWLLEDDTYEGGTPQAYIDLGTIKGNVGGQNYELPAEYDPAIHRTVLVWCLRFATPFAAASLS